MFKANTAALSTHADEIGTCRKQLLHCIARIDDVCVELGRDEVYSDFILAVKSTRRAMEDQHAGLRNLRDSILRISTQYLLCENRIRNASEDGRMKRVAIKWGRTDFDAVHSTAHDIQII